MKKAKSGCMNRKGEQQGNMKRGVMQKERKGCRRPGHERDKERVRMKKASELERGNKDRKKGERRRRTIKVFKRHISEVLVALV